MVVIPAKAGAVFVCGAFFELWVHGGYNQMKLK